MRWGSCRCSAIAAVDGAGAARAVAAAAAADHFVIGLPHAPLLGVDGLVEALVAGVVEHLGDQPRHRIAEYDRLWAQQYFAHSEPVTSPEEATV